MAFFLSGYLKQILSNTVCMADVMSVQFQPSEIQGRIQDFPEGGAPAPKKEVTTYYSAKFPQKPARK